MSVCLIPDARYAALVLAFENSFCTTITPHIERPVIATRFISNKVY